MDDGAAARFDNLKGQCDPPPLPAPTRGAGALTAPILKKRIMR